MTILVEFMSYVNLHFDFTFRMPIYPMLNQWNANPMTANHGVWLVESNVDSYEYWWEHFSYAYLSHVKWTECQPNDL